MSAVSYSPHRTVHLFSSLQCLLKLTLLSIMFNECYSPLSNVFWILLPFQLWPLNPILASVMSTDGYASFRNVLWNTLSNVYWILVTSLQYILNLTLLIAMSTESCSPPFNVTFEMFTESCSSLSNNHYILLSAQECSLNHTFLHDHWIFLFSQQSPEKSSYSHSYVHWN